MPTPPTTGAIHAVAPTFLVDDVERTAEWYRDHLGFDIGDYFRDDHGPHDESDIHHPAAGEAIFVILQKGGSPRLMLSRTEQRGLGVRSNLDAKPYSMDAYFWVEDVAAYHEAVRATGIPLEQELCEQPYGLSEFTVRDCDGHTIVFGG